MANRLAQRRRYYIPLLACCLAAVSVCAAAAAHENKNRPYFSVRSAETTLVDGVYRLHAQVDFKLSKEAREALQNGVPLVLKIEIKVVKIRPWIWDATVAKLAQRYRVDFHALSQRYLVKNQNTGVRHSFRNLDEVLAMIGNLTDFPMLDRKVLDPSRSYMGRVRGVLDIERLPTPIRLWAYSSRKWRLASEWYEWRILH